MEVADRVVIMKDGRSTRHGAPIEIYQHPATPFIA